MSSRSQIATKRDELDLKAAAAVVEAAQRWGKTLGCFYYISIICPFHGYYVPFRA
jgi:hypothetical protein